MKVGGDDDDDDVIGNIKPLCAVVFVLWLRESMSACTFYMCVSRLNILHQIHHIRAEPHHALFTFELILVPETDVEFGTIAQRYLFWQVSLYLITKTDFSQQMWLLASINFAK